MSIRQIFLGVSAGLLFSTASFATEPILGSEKFTERDALLVVDASGKPIVEWRANAMMVPASLAKLATAYLAINRWGLSHRFKTDFLIIESPGDKVVKQLWIKGYGDPFLVSEELDLVVSALQELELEAPSSIHIDNRYFNITSVPGRSTVADPYNAPLSAVAANFNTAMLQSRAGRVASAEQQTPLTPTAKKVAPTLRLKKERVNLINASNAQRNFAELLQLKMGWKAMPIYVDQTLPASAKRVYQHQNSRTLGPVLRGTLEFSNNFIANQLFLNQAEQASSVGIDFQQASDYASSVLTRNFGWDEFSLVDGAGLSRNNRLSALQLDDLLAALKPNKTLLKRYKIAKSQALVHAKTGTLSDVQSYAGFIEFPESSYRFVFLFNRKRPYGYREQLLEKLVMQLHSRQGNFRP